MLRSLLLLLPLVGATPGSVPSVPQKTIPPPVLLELRTLENQFDQALSHDCSPERCVSKGCTYGDHVVVDLPRSSSLPGVDQSEGPGSVPSQEYLTSARCDFAVEKSVAPKDALALTHRLEQRLTKGWLKVTVGHQTLEPVSASLSEAPVQKPVAPPPSTVQTDPSTKWEAGVAGRELWVHLLPHFAWMIAILLGTLAVLTVIWALRRLGRESIEEQALKAQLSSGGLSPTESTVALEAGAAPKALASGEAGSPEDTRAYVDEQQRLWTERVSKAELGKDEDGLVDLLREWLKTREFDLLAKAIFAFGDRLSLAFSSDGELAVRKVEFAEYLRSLDPKSLPSDASFFQTLNQHAISSSLLSQADADIYRSLREEFGSAGVAHLVEALPARHGALLFALVPADCQDDVARILPGPVRLGVAQQLLFSNRISGDERRFIFEAVEAARTGAKLPPAPIPLAHDILDRGREVDAAASLSVLLPYIETRDRTGLFSRALQRSGGAFPTWYEDILFPDMLLKLPAEQRADLLLEVDVKRLAGWSSLQPHAWQEVFLGGLAPTMRTALRANMSFASRAEQLQMAREGRSELVSAVKRRIAGGRVAFAEMVA